MFEGLSALIYGGSKAETPATEPKAAEPITAAEPVVAFCADSRTYRLLA
jgi:hypothetical protein